MEETNNTRAHDLQIEIVFGRKIMSQILTIFIPTILICIVSFSTSCYRPQYFEALVTVNLTSLLVLTTLFISVCGLLPTTSYVKMIDSWLIFALMMPYAEVILHTIIRALRSEEEIEPGTQLKLFIDRSQSIESLKKEQLAQLEKIARKKRNDNIANFLEIIASFVIPALFTVFVFTYFAVGKFLAVN